MVVAFQERKFKPVRYQTGDNQHRTCSSGTGGDGRYQAARAVDLLTLSLLFTGIQEKRGENPVYLA